MKLEKVFKVYLMKDDFVIVFVLVFFEMCKWGMSFKVFVKC